MKKLIIPIICALVLGLFFYKYNNITNLVSKKIVNVNTVKLPSVSKYAKHDDFIYVQNTNDFVPYSRQDLINIVYTVLNNGVEKFVFYCPKAYEECVTDMTTLSGDDMKLTELNNFVHPYNAFTNIKTSISESGEITLNISYLYTKEQIDLINIKVKELEDRIIDKNKSDYDNIKNIHDEIINTTKYDVERNKNNYSDYLSYIAYGPLYEHYATCNGYTDLMAIILTDMNIKNYKISTDPKTMSENDVGHIWNAVYINNKWLHLDLTWDDPISTDGKNYLYHTYFLIDTNQLKKADVGEEVVLKEHKFDESIYRELKN